MFMRVEVQAKEYIDETETVKSISVSTKDDILNDVVETYPGSASPPQNNSGMLGMQSGGNQSINTSASNTSVVNNQENDQNTAGDSCGFKMEKPKMPKFSGDVREYAIFDDGCFFGSEDHWEEVDARRHALWWLWRPILDLQALEQDGHVNVVSVTGWLAESFRRCRFSAAAVFLPSSKLSAAVLIVPLHSSLSSASASHSLWSMPACVSCRFNWSLKRLRGAPRSRLP